MASPSFPAGIDALANPGPTTETDDTGYELDIVVSRLQNCVMAIENKLGIGTSAPGAAAAVLRRTGAGASAWGQVAAGDIAPGAVGAVEAAITPAATIYHSAAQSIANNTNTVLAFDSEVFDTDTMHSTSTNNSRMTARTAGVYVLIAEIYWFAQATGYRQVFLKYNGGSGLYENTVQAVNGAATSQVLVAIASLAVNDYIEAWVAQGSGASLNVQGSGGQVGTFFHAAWLGKAT